MHEKNQSDKNREVTSQSGQESVMMARGVDPIVFFKKDKAFAFAHQKIEKLVAAVYIMTNFFENKEPLKWSLRSLGMKLLRQNIDLKNSIDASSEASETKLRESVLEIVSMIEVASFAGLISEMNLAILKREFHVLLSHIQKTIHIKQSGSLFNSSEHPFFEVILPTESARPIAAPDASELSYKPQVFVPKGNAASETVKDNSDQDIRSADTKAVSQGQSIGHAKRLKEYGPVAVKRNKRQSAIINLLKRKKEIMVRDVSEIIHDCSEKTLQRELLALVSEGVLKKTGERRWSRYSLA